MDVEEFRKRGYEIIDFICDYHKSLESLPVKSNAKPGELIKALPTEAPQDPQSMDDIMKDVSKLVIPGLTNWQSPNFFAFFSSNSSFPGILGDLLSTGLGVQGMLWLTSPACTELEMVVLDWLGKMVQLPEKFLFSGTGGGVIQGTASEAVLTCLVAARHHVVTANTQKGLTEEEVHSKLTVYSSDQSHTSIKKACMIAGVPLSHFRVVPTDAKLAMKADELRNLIQADKAKGLLPCFVSCTVGTTSTGACDDLNAIGAVCNDEGLWLHVDAAYAGPATTCPEFRYLIDGVEKASSFNFNPHKWMLTNFDCSTLWVSSRKQLTDALDIVPAYLKNAQSDAGLVVDYRNWQIPLGRRFRALKLWFVLRTYGVKGIQEHIRRHVQMAVDFEKRVGENPNFEIAYPRCLSLVCFRLKGSNEQNKALVDRLNDSGKLMLTQSVIEGVTIVRFAIGGTYTRENHVADAWKLIAAEGEAILKQ
eukprot:TRINITY_DN301_c0_g1_i1.p1 TRINITY_DN301_c0_g1~~TRINITY_DN301_c0_g1_i1.p1  ORF type:complete len:501 (-),score=119.99 TRINITY_DN301_c0_g1_i1:53-1483(-)